MQEQEKIEETVDSIKDYMNTQYELMILKSSDKIAHLGSNLLSIIPLVFLSLLTVLMLSFAFAFYLNIKLVSEYYGFLIVGGIFLVIALFVVSTRKSLFAKPLRNKIIREMLHSKHLN